MITFANHRIIENWNYFQPRFYKIICLRIQTPGLRVVAFEYCPEAYSGSYKLMPSNVKQRMLIQMAYASWKLLTYFTHTDMQCYKYIIKNAYLT